MKSLTLMSLFFLLNVMTLKSQVSLAQLFDVQNGDGLVYGGLCGISGQPPEMRKDLKKAIDEEDIDKINAWMNSDHPVKQAYAIEGYLILKKKDKIIADPLFEDKIDQLASSEAELNFCNGCMYSKFTLGMVVSMILEDYNI